MAREIPGVTLIRGERGQMVAVVQASAFGLFGLPPAVTLEPMNVPEHVLTQFPLDLWRMCGLPQRGPGGANVKLNPSGSLVVEFR